jgi:hypothetical protein
MNEKERKQEKLSAAYQYALKSPEGQAILEDLKSRWEIDVPLGIRAEADMYYRAALRDAWDYINERLRHE